MARSLSLAPTTTDKDKDAAGGSGPGETSTAPLLSVTWRSDSAWERGGGDDDAVCRVGTASTTTHLEVAVAPVELQLDHLLLRQLLTVAYTAQRLLRIAPVVPIVATSTTLLSTTPPPPLPPPLSARVTAEELRVRKAR